jgi:hypothetical protein
MRLKATFWLHIYLGDLVVMRSFGRDYKTLDSLLGHLAEEKKETLTLQVECLKVDSHGRSVVEVDD